MATDTPELVTTPVTVRGYLGDLYARALTWNRYFQWALGVAGAIIVGQQVHIYQLSERAAHAKVVFVRIDDLARHDIINYDEATESRPRAQESRSDLRRFARLYYSRFRSVVSRDFHESLYFLNLPLQEEAMRVTKAKDIDPFNASLTADEVDIANVNVKLTNLSTLPYRAEIAFDKLFYQTGTRQLRKPADTFILHVEFELQPPSDELLKVNALGLRITNMRLEPVFKPDTKPEAIAQSH
jgi:hypothetical protein